MEIHSESYLITFSKFNLSFKKERELHKIISSNSEDEIYD